MSNNWSSASYKLSKQGQAYVLVTLVGVAGSTPRNSGTKMVISKDGVFDTIGGGHLEHKVIKHANNMLTDGKNSQHIEHFQLGSQLGQCCGGNASVLFECFAATGVNIMLFGAGHVGKALVPILAQLPCQVTWVDSRAEQFPANVGDYENVVMLISDSPEFEVDSMPANSYFIVMTHNHQMDFDITQAVLKRADFHYLGLIASETKWRRFQQRYKHRDIAAEQVERMNCPIGLRQVGGKLPIEVAVSVSAEIIHTYQAQQAKLAKQEQVRASLAFAPNNQQHAKVKPDVKMRAKSQQGIHWQALKPLITAD